MSDVVQFYTNNDGTISGLTSNVGLLPEELRQIALRQGARNMSGVQTQPVGSSSITDPMDDPGGVPGHNVDGGENSGGSGSGTGGGLEVAPEQYVFLNRAGAYYKAVVRNHPSDMQVPFPSPEIEAHFAQDAAGNPLPTPADIVRDSLFGKAAAEGSVYDPLLTYKQKELALQDQQNKVMEQVFEAQLASQQISSELAEGNTEDALTDSSTPSTTETGSNETPPNVSEETGTDTSSPNQTDGVSTTTTESESTTTGTGTTTSTSTGF